MLSPIRGAKEKVESIYHPGHQSSSSMQGSVRLSATHSNGEDRPVSRRDALLWTGGLMVGSSLVWSGSSQRAGAEEGQDSSIGSSTTAPASASSSSPSLPSTYELEAPYRGEQIPLSKFRGKAVLVVNTKLEDPEALNQIPALTYLHGKYYKDGLRTWVFPTEQVDLLWLIML